MKSKKQAIVDLLMAMETGDPMAVGVINEDNYKQHNPMTNDGGKGIAQLFQNIALTNPKVEIKRVFQDGDIVFAHGLYDFGNKNVVFEVFRFDDEQTVEHWDNLQPYENYNASGRTMLDGSTERKDVELTEDNRLLVKEFVDTIFVNKDFEKISDYLEKEQLLQHSPFLKDGFASLKNALEGNDKVGFKYIKNHRNLADGNFVLSVNEAFFKDIHASFYDLFRLENNKIVEHWSTIHPIPPKSMWRNQNGKF